MIKRIMILLVAMISLQATAQVQTIGNPHNTVKANGRLTADSGYIFTHSDTTAITGMVYGTFSNYSTRAHSDSSYTPKTNTITINGATQQLGNNPSFSVSGGGGGIDRLGTRTYYLSKCGIASNANLAIYSTTFGTDQTATIQSILDSQKYYGAITVVWDVMVSGTGWNLHGNTTIVAPSAAYGAILRTSSNRPLFRNSDQLFGNSSIVDSNIYILGGTWNGNGFDSSGNRHNNLAGNSYGINAIIQMNGVVNLKIEGTQLLNSAGYYTDNHHVINFWIEGNTIYNNPLCFTSTDGIHADGGSHDGFITRNILNNCGDDNIAVNLDDIYFSNGSSSGTYYPRTAASDGYDIIVSQNICNGAKYGFRLLSGHSRASRILVKDNSFITSRYGIVIDNGSVFGLALDSIGRGNIGELTLENNYIQLKNPTDVGFEVADISIQSNIENLTIRGQRKDHAYNTSGTNSTLPTIYFSGTNKIQKVTISDFSMYDTSGYPGKYIYVISGDTINSLTLNNISFYESKDSGSSQTQIYILQNSGYIKSALCTGIFSHGLTFPFYNYGGIIGNLNVSSVTHESQVGTTTGFLYNTGIIGNFCLNGYVGKSCYYNTGTIYRIAGNAFDSTTFLPITSPTAMGNITTSKNIVTGGYSSKIHYIGSSNYTANDSEEVIYAIGGSGQTVGLPTPAITSAAKRYTVYAISGAVLVNGSKTVPAGGAIRFMWDANSTWLVEGYYGGNATLPIYNSGSVSAPSIAGGALTTTGLIEPTNYKLNTSYTTTSSDFLTTADGTSTIYPNTTTGSVQCIANYGSGGNVTVGGTNVVLPPKASVMTIYNNAIHSIVGGYGFVTYLTNNSPTPSISTSAGAGTSASASVVGDDNSGVITINSGSTPATNAVVAVVTFAGTYNNAPRVTLTPASLTVVNYIGSSQACWIPPAGVSNGVTTTTFTIMSNNTALTPGAVIQYYYRIN